MGTVFFELSDILTQLLSKYKITEAELSRKVDLPRATINRLVNGKTPDPRASTLEAIASYFDISVDQLLGKKPLEHQTQVDKKIKINLKLPVIDWNDSKLWHEIINKLNFDNHKEWVSTDFSLNKNLFCVKVNGDAMWPSFEKDTILIIDPLKVPASKSLILVHIHYKNEIVFRQLIIDGQCRMLNALNPIFPAIELNVADKIIGTIIETRSNHS